MIASLVAGFNDRRGRIAITWLPGLLRSLLTMETNYLVAHLVGVDDCVEQSFVLTDASVHVLEEIAQLQSLTCTRQLGRPDMNGCHETAAGSLPLALRQLNRIYYLCIYSERMNDPKGFDWDAASVAHILRHAVTPFDVEEVVGRAHLTIAAKTIKGKKRWKLFGKMRSGRYLVVVFTIRRRLFRTVTAYEMNVSERKKYAPQIDERT